MTHRIDWITLNIPVADDRVHTLFYEVSPWTSNVHHKQSKGIAVIRFSNLPDRDYQDILAWVGEHLSGRGVTLSRLDLAYDFQQPFDIPAFYEKEREVRPKSYKMGLLGSPEGGYTCYLGSRVSGLYRRIYDKQKQLKLSYEATRVEIEYKRKLAKMMFLLLSNPQTSEKCATDTWLKLVGEMPDLALLWRPQGELPKRTCPPRDDTKWMLDNSKRLSEILDNAQGPMDKLICSVIDRCTSLRSLSRNIEILQARYDYLHSRSN